MRWDLTQFVSTGWTKMVLPSDNPVSSEPEWRDDSFIKLSAQVVRISIDRMNQNGTTIWSSGIFWARMESDDSFIKLSTQVVRISIDRMKQNGATIWSSGIFWARMESDDFLIKLSTQVVRMSSPGPGWRATNSSSSSPPRSAGGFCHQGAPATQVSSKGA